MSATPLKASHPVDSQSDGIADYLSHFGLDRPPFDASIDAFFGAHGRQALLAQLLHLLHFSEAPTLLVGPEGAGKTAFLQALRDQLAEQDYVFYIEAPAITTSSQLLLAIAQGIGLAVSPQDNLARLQARLREWVEFSGGSLQAYLLVDDAEALSSDAVATLQTLVTGSAANCWHLLAAGSSVMVDKFNAQAPEAAEPAQVFSLPEVTQDFVADYLSFRLDQAGYTGPPILNEADEALIYQACGGDLNRVHDCAEIQLLHRLEVTPTAHRLPLWHMGALAGLLLMLGVAWIGYESPTAGTAAVDAAINPLPMDQPTEAATLATPDAGAQPAPFDEETEASRPTPVQLKAIDAPAARAIEIAEAPPAEPVATKPEPVDDPLMHTGTRSPTPAASTYTEDERHLLARAANRYTLQVLAASSSTGVNQFVARHAGQPLRVYRTQRNGQPWHVVVLGDFSSSDEARAAIQTLPKTLQKSGPWPRDMASVQQQINQQS